MLHVVECAAPLFCTDSRCVCATAKKICNFQAEPLALGALVKRGVVCAADEAKEFGIIGAVRLPRQSEQST
eukprot:2053433-Pleurochrysis_carterae.AAC.1